MASPPLLERFLRFVTPQPDLGFTPPPCEIGPGIWRIDRRARQVALPVRSTAVALGAGRLLLISPPADPCPELARLGSVSAIVAPNSFHYLHAAAWLQRHPQAELFTAPGLARRVPALPPSVELMPDAAVAWRDRLPWVVLGPSHGLSEVLFFHPESRTLILTDVASNLVDLPRAWDRFACRLVGLPATFGTTRNSRNLFLNNAALARTALRAAAAWPFERILVAHGALVERDARAVFERAFAPYL